MPTYDFACPEGHEFEKFYRTISAAPSEVECPVCGRPATRRVSGGAGLLFKGSGFYITDYGKDGKKDLKTPPSKPSTSTKTDAGKGDAGATKSDASSSPAASPSPSPTKSSE